MRKIKMRKRNLCLGLNSCFGLETKMECFCLWRPFFKLKASFKSNQQHFISVHFN